jgi:lipoyl(octanoyl) transferase
VIIQYEGLIAYHNALLRQADAHNYVERTGRPVCLGCEHYPVITLGKRLSQGPSQSSNALPNALSEAWGNYASSDLEARGFEIVSTDRGGQATLHSPGQLVIYPILPLRDYKMAVRDYVRLLEDCTIQCLKLLKVEAYRHEDEAGVFTKAGKLAFIGIRVERGISRHGISLNVSNNLDLFQYISACGVQGRALDSLERQGLTHAPEEIFQLWINVFIHELLEFRSKSSLQDQP